MAWRNRPQGVVVVVVRLPKGAPKILQGLQGAASRLA